jgi:hypothetical protein
MKEHSDLQQLTRQELLYEQEYINKHIDELQADMKKLARNTDDDNPLRKAIQDHTLALYRLHAICIEWERRQCEAEFQCY